MIQFRNYNYIKQCYLINLVIITLKVKFLKNIPKYKEHFL